MLLLTSVRTACIITSGSHQLLHERIKRSHLGCGISQLVRDDCSNGRSLQVTADRFEQQAAVLRYLRGHQFPGTLNLIEILHGTLCIGKIFQHLVLHTVYPVESNRYGSLGSNDFLMSLLAFVIDILQCGCLCKNSTRQCRVCLLCKSVRTFQQKNCKGNHYRYS